MLPLFFAILLLGVGGLLKGITGPPGGPYPLPAPAACAPHLEYNRQIRVDVNANKERFSDGRPLYKPKEEKLWVLVKRDAPIPTWKVQGGAKKERNGEELGEMEEMGRTTVVDPSNPDNPLNQNPDALGERVFIGLGHCNGDPGKECLDPLTQDTLFVVRKTEEEWWEFNVYYDLVKLPHNPTDEDLPCWMKMECAVENVMGDCRMWMIETNCGEYPHEGNPPPEGCKLGKAQAKTKTPFFARVLAHFKVFSQTTSPPSFIRKEEITIEPGFKDELEDIYWSETQTDKDPEEIGAEFIGKYPKAVPVFRVFYFSEAEMLILSSSSSPPFYTYVPLISLVRPGAKSLQLGTFFPIKTFHYEWYTPSCKPAIYLYPREKTTLSVQVKPQGKITESIPEHGIGWKDVVAYPDGEIVYQGRHYPYLYYEAEIERVRAPDKGWVVEKKELENLFDELLPFLGLNQKEIYDFKDYWLKVLDETPYYFVGVIGKEELERIEPIEFSQKPDTFIRVRLFFEPLEQPVFVEPPYLPPPPSRQGFVAVDWGGILSSGTCQGGKAFNSTSR